MPLLAHSLAVVVGHSKLVLHTTAGSPPLWVTPCLAGLLWKFSKVSLRGFMQRRFFIPPLLNPRTLWRAQVGRAAGPARAAGAGRAAGGGAFSFLPSTPEPCGAQVGRAAGPARAAGAV